MKRILIVLLLHLNISVSFRAKIVGEDIVVNDAKKYMKVTN